MHSDYPDWFLVSLMIVLYKLLYSAFIGIYPDSITQIYFKLDSTFINVFFCPFLLTHTSEMYLLNISLISLSESFAFIQPCLKGH